jgi:hypothetical protein
MSSPVPPTVGGIHVVAPPLPPTAASTSTPRVGAGGAAQRMQMTTPLNSQQNKVRNGILKLPALK